MTSELSALKNLKQSFKKKYKKKIPELKSCFTPTLAQIAADDFCLKFITDTLEALGEERSRQVLSRLQISHGIRSVKAKVESLQTKLRTNSIPVLPKLPARFDKFREEYLQTQS